jgi:RimJ/RimL family protein N-acetyltransferase
VTLWVLAENQQARDFYARFGFEPDGAEMKHAGSGEKEVRLRGPVAALSGSCPGGALSR